MIIEWLKKLLGLERSGLDRVLFRYPDRTPFTVRNSLEHVQIFGRIGSGKSSGGGKHFFQSYIDYPKSGGLWLGSKPEDAAFARKLFRKRPDDLIFFGPREEGCFNIMDYLGHDTREVTRYISTSQEVIARMSGRPTDAFWQAEQGRAIYNAVEILRQASGRISVSEIQKFILDAATAPTSLADPEWKKGFHNQTIWRAIARKKTAVEQHDFDLAFDYWVKEFPSMASKQRSGVIGMVMSVLYTMNTGIVREKLSTRSTLTPDVMDEGKWVFVDANPLHESDRILLLAWKYATQKWILDRVDPKNPVYLFIDEAQNVVNSVDAEFQGMSRSHMGGQVMLTQSINSYFSMMPGDKGAAFVKTLLGNVATKVFHHLACDETAEYGAKLLGMRKELIESYSPADATPAEFITGNFAYRPNYSEQYQYILQPSILMDGCIRTGGPPHNIVDGIVIGGPFRHGQRHLFMEFKQ